MINLKTMATLFGTLLLASACSSTQSTLAVTEHTAKAQCAGIPSGITKMTTQRVQQLQQRQFLTEGSADTPTKVKADTTTLLVAVSHGDQPSPGYRFELRSATVSNGVAQLNLHWVTPPADSMQATVMTSPCLVLALPQGEYHRVVAQDQNGVFGSVDLTP